MSVIKANLQPCTVCRHTKRSHQLQPRPVLCRECQDETKGTKNTKATHVFRGEGEPK